ncbi:MAG: chromosomal replication initiator protein DnaA [Treponema sp.]|nr:chromosomal replication initiator protein DnaA [Treponema sp.]
MSDNNYKEIWVEALNQLRNQYKENGRENEFNLWFNLEYVSDQGNEITAAVASDFMLSQMIERGNIKTIKEKIKEISGIDIEIMFVVKNTSVSTEKEEKETAKTPKKIEAEKIADENLAHHHDLNENFTFDTFVPGDNNMYAYQASIAASKNPGKAYNPILLYGGSGLGKTHLMQSIGNYIYEEKKGKVKLAYINTESLMNEFTSALRNKTPKNDTVQKFKNKYRNLDIFLLDDIYFLGGTDALQDEIFYIFEALNQKKAQMVFTCDRPINEVNGIKERLRTRFSNGICIDMQPPNYETRKAILLKKLSLMNKTLNDEIIDFIAANIESDVRDLEGALKKVVGYSEFMNKEITIDIAKQLLQESISSNLGGNVSIETIQKIVADYYGISVSEIKSKKQNKKVAFPRHVSIYIARKLTEMSFTEIGSEFGGKDHSTIMSSCKKIEDLIKIDATLDNAIKNMIKEIKSKK